LSLTSRSAPFAARRSTSAGWFLYMAMCMGVNPYVAFGGRLSGDRGKCDGWGRSGGRGQSGGRESRGVRAHRGEHSWRGALRCEGRGGGRGGRLEGRGACAVVWGGEKAMRKCRQEHGCVVL
jgi:hypothetical protein